MDAVERVRQALGAAGVAARVVELPQSTRTAAEAAAAMGCGVAQIAKSIIFRRTDTSRAVLVITSGINRVDEKKVSAHIGAKIGKADADFVRAATGYVIGGVPPLGHAQPVETLIDEDLLRFERIWAAAGTPNALFEASTRDLVRAAGGRVLAVAAAKPG